MANPADPIHDEQHHIVREMHETNPEDRVTPQGLSKGIDLDEDEEVAHDSGRGE